MQKLSQLTTHAAGLIDAIPLLAGKGITAICESRGNIVSMVKQAVGKLGLAVIVLTPDAEPLTASIDTTIRIRPRIVVEVVENGGMNKTGLAALDVVAELLPVLHRAPNGFQPAGQPRRPGLHEITLDPKVPYELVPDDMLVVYHVNTSTEITLSRSPAAPDPAP